MQKIMLCITCRQPYNRDENVRSMENGQLDLIRAFSCDECNEEKTWTTPYFQPPKMKLSQSQ